jgi:serine protease inhibitor
MSGRLRAATPFSTSPEVKSVVDGNTVFALDLYQKLKDQPGNLFFSPYSISTALAMTYAGARGRTEGEMSKTLQFTHSQETLHAAFGALGVRMNRIQIGNRITLTTANSIWCQRDYRFTDAFLNTVRSSYGADARQVDFKHAASAATGEINKWVEQKTNGKIKDVAEPDQFTDYTRLVLCNAIYFKGKWLNQFKAEDTKPAPFSVTTNQTVTVSMMYQHSEFKMTQSEDDSVELLELPYSGNDLSMIILMPNTTFGLNEVQQASLSDLEQKLTAGNLHAWLTKLDRAGARKTFVGMPRFTTTRSFELANPLKSLGMPSAFSEAANFSGMDGTTNLFIAGVFHKALIEVNEEGTEAAAATGVHVATRSMSGRFIADHPFFFLIRENGSGTLLFLGRIVEPTK